MDANEIGMLLWSLCFLLVGLLSLVQPEKMLPRTIRDKLHLADYKPAVIIAQAIGASFIVIGLTALARLWFGR